MAWPDQQNFFTLTEDLERLDTIQIMPGTPGANGNISLDTKLGLDHGLSRVWLALASTGVCGMDMEGSVSDGVIKRGKRRFETPVMAGAKSMGCQTVFGFCIPGK